jgi:hypothetical protein
VDINQDISDFLNSKKKFADIKSLAIVNNDLFLYLSNSYFIRYNSTGILQDINKLYPKLGSYPIFTNNNIMYLDQKNKLIIKN